MLHFKHILQKLGLLSLFFAISFIPDSLADTLGSWEEFVQKIAQKRNITLIDNISSSTEDISLTPDQQIIDFNSKTLTGNTQNTSVLFNIRQNAETTFKNGAIKNFNGGIININSDTSAIIKDMKFISNTSNGVIKNSGQLSISGTNVFENNINQTSDGGAIYNATSGEIVITGKITFNNNQTINHNGGAIYNEGLLYLGTQSEQINALFTSNTAENGNGGVIYNSGTLKINGKVDFGQARETTSTKTTDITSTFSSEEIANFVDSKTVVSNTSQIITTTKEKITDENGNIKIIQTEETLTWKDVGVNGITGTTTTTQKGAAIYNTGTLELTGTGSFAGNKSQKIGAIYNDGQTTLNGTYTFITNRAEEKITTTNEEGKKVTEYIGKGGAIYNTENGTLNLIGTFSFSNGLAEAGGGAIYNMGQAYLRGDFTFNNNRTNKLGNVIYNAINSYMNIQGSAIFMNNQQPGEGGAIYNQGTMTITGTRNNINTTTGLADSTIIFENNGGNNLTKGGAIQNLGESPTNRAILNINNIDFYNNRANTNGGAIRLDFYSSGNIANSNFINNKVMNSKSLLGYGGALGTSNNNVSITIANSYFKNNQAATGGAVSNGDTITILNSSFYNNNALEWGGAISFNGHVFKLIADEGDVIFDGNTADGISDAILIYTGSYQYGSNPQEVYFNAGNEGEIIFNDRVNGEYEAYSSKIKVGTLNINKAEMLNGSPIYYSTYDYLLENSSALIEAGTINTTGNKTAPYDGRVIFNNSINRLNVALYNGTLVIGEDPDTIGDNNYITSSSDDYGHLYLYGGTLDLLNNNIEQNDKLAFTSVKVDGSVNLEIDMDLSNGIIDYINSAITGSGTLNLSKIGLLGDLDNYVIGNTKSFQFAQSNNVTTTLSAIAEVIVSNNAGYMFKISQDFNAINVTKIIDAGGLPVALSSGATYGVSAEFSEEGETITTWNTPYNIYIPEQNGTGTIEEAIGTNYQKGQEFRLSGNNKTLKGTNNITGIIIGNPQEDGTTLVSQTFYAENLSDWSGFNTALTVNDGSTAYIENVTFGENQTADIYNNGTIYFSGINTIESGIEGATDSIEGPKGSIEITAGTTSSNATINQKELTIGKLATLNIDADNLDTATTNNGTINLHDGLNDNDISGTNGKINITGEVENIATINQETLKIKKDSSLTNYHLTADETQNGQITIKNTILNEGTLKSNVATISGQIDNQNSLYLSGGTKSNYAKNQNKITDSQALYTGTLYITSGSYIENLATITQKSMYNQGYFRSNISLLDFSDMIDNAGTLTLIGSDSDTAAQTNKIVNGTGTLILEKKLNNTANITQKEIKIANDATIINQGTITGNIINQGSLTSNANNLHGTVENNANLTLTGGTITHDISGTNALTTINGNVTLANEITINNDVVVNENRALVANLSSLIGTITNHGIIRTNEATGESFSNVNGNGELRVKSNLTNYGTIENSIRINNGWSLSTALDLLESDVDITNDGTFNILGTYNYLNKNILEKGTTTLKEGSELQIADGVNIEGTLNLNGATLNTQSNLNSNIKDENETETLSNITINTLEGSGLLKLDIDMEKLKSDTITVENANNATLTVENINIIKDAITSIGKETITFLDSTANIVTNVKNNVITVLTDAMQYVFTQGATSGTLDVTSTKLADISLRNYLLGVISGDKYSVTKSEFTYDEAIATTENTNKNLLVDLNNVKLYGSNKEHDGITITEGYTLTLNNATTGASATLFSTFNEALVINEGANLNIKNVNFENNNIDILNNGTINITGQTNATKIDGTGTLNIAESSNLNIKNLTQKTVNNYGSLTLTLNNTINIENPITNTGTIYLIGSTEPDNADNFNIKISGKSKENEGEVNLYNNINLKNTINANKINITEDANINATDEAAILNATIKNEGNLNANALKLKGSLENQNNLILSGGTLDINITGSGDTTIKNNTTISENSSLKQTELTISDDATLENKGTIKATVTNKNIINNQGAITGSLENNGTITQTTNATITSTGNSQNNGEITNGNFIIGTGKTDDTSVFTNKENAELTATTTVSTLATLNNEGLIGGSLENSGEINNSGNITANITNKQQATLTNSKTINGYTKNLANATIENQGSIEGTLENEGEITQTTSGTITAVIENNGNIKQGTVQALGTSTNNGSITSNLIVGNGTDEAVLENKGTLNNVTVANLATLKSDVNKLSRDITNNNGTVLLTSETTNNALNISISGSGTTEIDGDITLNTNKNINTNALINNNANLTASLAQLNNTITNNGTLNLTDNNITLNKDIKGLGTTVLKENSTLNINTGTTINGTLQLNNNTINLQASDDSSTVDMKETTIGSIQGTANLKLDVNMKEKTSDKINISSGSNNNATLNLTSINILKDDADGQGGTNVITYLTNNLNNIDVLVNGKENGTITTVTNRYIYTFSSNTTGSLNATNTLLATNYTLKEFIEGTLPINATTYSFTDDIILSGNEVPLGVTDKNKNLNIYLNGYVLKGIASDGITIANDYTLNINGLTEDTNTSVISNFNTALINEGTLNINDITFTNNNVDITNNNNLILNGNNSFNSSITGNGNTFINSGTTQIASLKQDNLNVSNTSTIKNNGNIEVTSLLLNNGTIDNAGTITATISNNKNALIENGKILALGDSSNQGTIDSALTIGNGNDTATFTNIGTLNNVTISEKATLTNNGNIDSNITNNGTLTTSVNNIKDVENNGRLTLTDSQANLDINITGSKTGETIILGDITLQEGSLSRQGITTITNNASLDIGSNNITLGTLNIDGILKLNIDSLSLLTKSVDNYIGSKIVADNVNINNNSILYLTIATNFMPKNTKKIELQLIESDNITGQFSQILSNLRYQIIPGSTAGSYIIKNIATATDIASLAGNRNNQNTAQAFDSINPAKNSKLYAVQSILNELSQHNAKAYAQALTAVAPQDNQLVLMTTHEISNTLNHHIAHRFDEDGCMCNLDNFKKGSAWIEGFGISNQQSHTFSQAGFKAHTTGYILGYDGAYDEDITIGFGYAFNHTSADSYSRKTKINGHTLFTYARYQPSLWYIRALASYSFQNYKEQSHLKNIAINSKYNVHAASLETASGLDTPYNITPEIGLRYTFIAPNDYTDTIGQNVKNKDMNLLTAQAQLKYRKNYQINQTELTPNAHFGITYDLTNTETTANVSVYDSIYAIKRDNLARLGFNTGLGFTFTKNNLDIDTSYDIDFRKHYTGQSINLKLRYNF